jgi:riboflavin kinase / FMN adenylyltransferase
VSPGDRRVPVSPVASAVVEILRDPVACPAPDTGTVVTIGAYDGVHRGHATVIARVRRLAEERGMATAVVTFDRHPASVVRPESAPLLLTDLDQKLELLAATGVDYTRVIHFDEVRSKEPAEEFVRDDLVGCLNARVVVVGADFHFGHRRAGNVELLRRLGTQLGFEVAPVELVGPDGQPSIDAATRVSSTRIRTLLKAGELAVANGLLGRQHEVRGVVGEGDKRGRELGFPTANVEVPEEICLPRDGIYAGWYLRPDGRRHPCAINLGRRPTFYDDQPYSLLEAHLLDFDDDLYGEPAKVRFAARLRDEIRYDSVSELVGQISLDCEQARQVLVP